MKQFVLGAARTGVVILERVMEEEGERVEESWIRDQLVVTGNHLGFGNNLYGK